MYESTESLTAEQADFVLSPVLENCKLVSVPGSGKTTCIVARARHVRDHLTRDRVLILCFQRFVADSIRCRLNTGEERIDVCTIDALARRALVHFCPENSKEVRCFSSHFHELLASDKVSDDDLKACLTPYSCVFVDEAQDLNDLQYRLVRSLTKRLCCPLVLIGDPNQTIYHFRGASPEYLLDYEGKCYTLSHNFRSCPDIVSLGNAIGQKSLHKFHCVDARATQPHRPGAIRVVHGAPYELLNHVALRLQGWAAAGNDLSDVCIVSPTRGQSDHYPNLGCAQVSNYLRLRGVKTSRFYSESGDAPTAQPYMPVPGHVNVMTVCAAKGLQWRLLMLATPHHEWFNTGPSLKDHSEHAHQIFVAATRARHELDIMTVPGCLHTVFSALYAVPHTVMPATHGEEPSTLAALLATATPLETDTDDRRFVRCHVTQLVSNADPDILKFFSAHVIVNETAHKVAKAFVGDGSSPPDGVFLGMLAEKVFLKEVGFHRKMTMPAVGCIENWYSRDMVVCPSEHVQVTSRLLRRGCTDLPPALPPDVRDRLLEGNRAVPIDRITHDLVVSHVPRIVRAYITYKSLNGTPDKCMGALFMVTLALYAYNTRHFLHVRDRGLQKLHVMQSKQVLQNARSMGRALAQKDDRPIEFSKRVKLFVKKEADPERQKTFILHGEVDIVHGGVATELKATHNTTLDHALQVYLYARMLAPNPRRAKILNVMTGIETTYMYSGDAGVHSSLVQQLVRRL